MSLGGKGLLNLQSSMGVGAVFTHGPRARAQGGKFPGAAYQKSRD
jgi:hypothetical protein